MFKDPFKELLINKIKNTSFNPMLHVAPFYTDEVEENIKAFKNNIPPKVEFAKWRDLFQKHQDDPLMLYAMLDSREIPHNIVYDMVCHEMRVYDKYHGEYSNEKHMSRVLMYKALEYPLPQNLINEMFKMLNTDILERLQEFNTPLDPDVTRKNYCPFHQDNLKHIGNLVLPFKKYKQKWYQQPFRLITDEKYLEAVINSPKCTETVREAIVNNNLIGDEIREIAFNEGVNFQNILYAPLSVKDTIYESAISTYTELSVNPATRHNRVYGVHHTKEDLKTYNDSMNFLQSKLSNDFLEESHQLDMVYRLKELHGGKSKDWILHQLFKHTNSKAVLDVASQFKLNQDVETAYQNKAMDKKYVFERVDEILKKLEKDRNARITDAQINTLIFAIENYPLSDKNYYTILHSSTSNDLLLNCATSPAVPIHTLEKIIDRCDYLIDNYKKLNKEKEHENQINLLKEIKFASIINKCIKGNVSREQYRDWMNMFNCFKLTARTIEADKINPKQKTYKVHTAKDYMPKNSMEMMEFELIYGLLPPTTYEKTILKNLRKERDILPADSEFRIKLQEMINEIEATDNMFEKINTEKYDTFNTDVLDYIQRTKIKTFCNRAENDLKIFYNGFNDFLKEFSKIQFQIDIKELEQERTKQKDFEL